MPVLITISSSSYFQLYEACLQKATELFPKAHSKSKPPPSRLLGDVIARTVRGANFSHDYFYRKYISAKQTTETIRINVAALDMMTRFAFDISFEEYVSKYDINALSDFSINTDKLSPHSSFNIAQISNDADQGKDYLGIDEDVSAFARIIVSKKFTPPLAIGLFGKWGTGKSFFINHMITKIKELSNEDNTNTYCKGVAQIHFNAWSYLDANLWASIVSRIFEKLNHYIGNDEQAKKDIANIEQELKQKLQIVNEEVFIINNQKNEVNQQIENLLIEKQKLNNTIDTKVKEIRNQSFSELFKAENEAFHITAAFDQVIEENAELGITKENLQRIIPSKYWDNPNAAYQQTKSALTFLIMFFDKKNILWNIFFIAVAIISIWLIPAILLNLSPALQDFYLLFTQIKLSLISLTLLWPCCNRLIATIKKWRPLIASLWKVKKDYQQNLEKAKFEHQQKEKSIHLEIEQGKIELHAINQRLQQSIQVLNELEFKVKNALATEALYSFIEKRCKSDDYRKHLGIVSVIRNDFNTLSKLFLDHNIENTGSEFRDRFKHPLERIVLYIDDLDRCPKERVVEVLEAVHLLMAFPLFVVIVGIDPRWVRNALIQRYEGQFGNGHGHIANGEIKPEEIDAGNYLEKIFQIPFHLREPTLENIQHLVRQLTVNQLDEKGESNLTQEKSKKTKLQTEIRLTPRQVRNLEALPLLDEYRPLQLTAEEAGFLESASKLIGYNPRAIKRYVNIYQIIRAHDRFMLTEATKTTSIKKTIFLLAMANGIYKDLYCELSGSIQHHTYPKLTLSDYLKQKAENKHKNSTYSSRYNAISSILSRKPFDTLEKASLSSFFELDQFVRRFTFTESEAITEQAVSSLE